eukprot:TRINITY_DN18687_c0_g1_i1.p1 TRINITY_DN18687_c0_g1~~TRINITY_DN18687_c0_g1_i1.p1  ORF type:complete len:325 (+),score=55.36 TRINITY_DN18687_c0_g1_i1:34-975(+)
MESSSWAKTKQTIKDTVAGGVGGTCLVLVGHPLDTIKVKLQTMSGTSPPLYTGTLDCAMKTVKSDGFFGLYRGMLAPLVGVTPMYSLCFFGYSIGKMIFTGPNSFKDLDLIPIGLAGATSGLFTTPILAPLERAKCILQIQGEQVKAAKAAGNPVAAPKFRGPWDVYRHLYNEGGLASVNRGFFSTMLRDSLASFFYFTTYEYIKAKWPYRKSATDAGLVGTLFAGGMAGIANWLGCIPIDTMKSKLQTAPEGKYPRGIRSVFAEIIRENGTSGSLRVLYRGVGPIMIRAFPANAACFYGYESASKFLNSVWP